jgi:peptidyl-prolyl cis-trans isomerase A (cyclophilin A)
MNPGPTMTLIRAFIAALCQILISTAASSVLASSNSNATVLPVVKVPVTGMNVQVGGFLPTNRLSSPVVRVLSSEGPFDMQLLPEFAPKTVSNFLRYVDADFYRGLIVHRSVTNFVVQTGGVALGGSAYRGYFLPEVPSFEPVTNEFRLSNTRGTVAMAKFPTDPNSATSQWFVNLADNTNLNTDNGGFTVFARVLGGGMSNVDRIGGLKSYNLTNTNPSNVFNFYGQMFVQTPLKNHDTNRAPFISSFVLISNVVRLPGAISSDPNAFTAEMTSNNTVQVRFRGFPSNNVTVAVHAYDSSTNLRTVSFRVAPPARLRKFTGLLERTNQAFTTLATLAVAPTGLFGASLANRTRSARIGSDNAYPLFRFRQKFEFTNANALVLVRASGESVAYQYGHEDAAFFAVDFAREQLRFTNTLRGEVMPHAYTGAGTDTCPLAGITVNAVLTRTNQLPRPVSGFLQFVFDKAGGTKITGLLPDNRGVSGSSAVVLESWGGDQLLPTGLFRRKGPAASLTGFLGVLPFYETNAPLGGALTWRSGTNAPAKLDVVAAVWTNRPGTNAISGDTNSVSCLLRIPGIPDQNVVWGPDNKPRFNPTNGMTIRFNAAKGLFSGVAVMVGTNGQRSKISYRGIVFTSAPSGFASGVRGCGLAALPGTDGTVPVLLIRP